MDLNTLWYILIAVLFAGFFVLEGFDYGVGILLPFVGKTDLDRRLVLNSIGPVWDANEVWMLTAGGAMFAAFPGWYASLFSGFYLALVLMLVALIIRGVAFEFRSKHDHPRWRSLWDLAIFIGSFVPALLWGVVMGNLIRGVAVDANQDYVGGFWALLNPFALLGGVASVLVFALHGALFLGLKTTGTLQERVRGLYWRIWVPTAAVIFGVILASYFVTDRLARLGVNPGYGPVLALGGILAAGWAARAGREGWGFLFTTVSIVFAVVTVAVALFPNVLFSSLNPEWSLTIYNTSSSPYTLKVMTIVALTMVPIVLAYLAWTYWVFRKRVSSETHLEY
ncbi:MAG: cytochrome d ubiquinol oxidase subunit II [Spirochaetes bacterium]|nr:cytochrome d ubiquinol oxidase subunit II [Spirochaetota bacterium]